jgi:uncharacterized protein (DUF362 family)
VPSGRRHGRGLTRRQFLTGAGVAGGCLALSAAGRLLSLAPYATAQEPELTPRAYLPLAMKRCPSLQPRVVHIRGSRATDWDFSTGWYGDFVRQDVVDQMVDLGVMQLTGAISREAAWQSLIPTYAPGERVAIKVNLNNARSVADSDNQIDALVELVNSVVTGLKEIAVAESDIWVYDAVRSIPDRLTNGCDFPGVQFSGRDVNSQGFSTTETITFAPPPDGPPLADQRISNVLANADYLINMPIMKKHGGAGVTLSFKNHFGTIDDCGALHIYVILSSSDFRPDYSPFVEIFENPHLVGKTVLTIGDGLYGGRLSQASVPELWASFGNDAPNSLFFSKDPVAIDCVMYDFLEAEAGVQPSADDHLILAAQRGLGVFEHRATGASNPEDWYSLIDYLYLDLG